MRNLYYVRADDVDGEDWAAHVVAEDSTDAYGAWLRDQDLTSDRAGEVFPDGAQVHMVLPDVPYRDSFVMGWTRPVTFGV